MQTLKNNKSVVIVIVLAMAIITGLAVHGVKSHLIKEDTSTIDSSYVYTRLPDETLSIDKYVGNEVDVNVPEMIDDLPVSMISPQAFKGNDTIKTVKIQAKITSIGLEAFADCNNLSKVILPDTVAVISAKSFNECTNLSDINLPNSLTVIGESAFEHCSKLKQINIPASVLMIPFKCFSGTSLELLIIPEGVTYIGGCAFENCEHLKKVSLPSSLQTVSRDSFPEKVEFTIHDNPKIEEFLTK